MPIERPGCECRITRKVKINGKWTPMSAPCARLAANNIVVMPNAELEATHPLDTPRIYRSVMYCTQHTKMLESIYSKPWMDTWVLKITNLRAARG